MTDPAALIEARLAEIRAAGDCPLTLPPVIRPWDGVAGFQSNAPHRVGIAHLRLRPRFLLLDPTGTGKTPQTLVAFGMLWQQTTPKMRLLVLCAKSAQTMWVEAVEKFLIGPRAKVVGRTPLGGEQAPDLRQLDYLDTSLDVLVTTYTTFANDLDTIKGMDLSRLVLVLDEAHRLKSLGQQKLRPAVDAISQHARYVWGLTATPQDTELMDLYSLFDVVRPGMFGSPTAFANRYMNRVWVRFGKPKFRGHKVPGKWHVKGYQHLDELRARMAPWSLSRPLALFETIMPGLRVLRYEVTLDSDHRRMYQIALGKVRDASSPVEQDTAIHYTQRLVDAPPVLGLETIKPPAKLRELIRLLQEELAGQHVLVFSRYATVCHWLQQELTAAGISTGLLVGSMGTAERDTAVRAFQAAAPQHGVASTEPSVPTTTVLVLSSAGGESLNLQQARAVVLYDLPWGTAGLIQLLGRARRRGSRHDQVLLLLITAQETVDTATLNVLTQRVTTTTTTTTTNSNPITNPSVNSEAIASAIAKELISNPPGLCTSVSTYELEALLLQLTGSDPSPGSKENQGYPEGVIPSSEEAVNQIPSSTSHPAGAGEPSR